MRYSADSQEAVRAETLGAAGSGQHFGHQLSHLEAVDLPRENQVGENPRRPPPRAGKSNRPSVSKKAEPWGHRDAPRKLPQDQRAKSVDRARAGNKVQRPPGTSKAG